MNVSDFLALMNFMKDTLIAVFGCLGDVVIVSDGTNELTLLGFFVGVGFVLVVLAFIKKVTQ